jgi:hypothetical protein
LIRYEEAKDQSQIAFCLDLYQMDKEIRHRGHTNVVVFACAAIQSWGLAAGQDVPSSAGQQQPEISAQTSALSGSKKSSAGVVAEEQRKTIKGRIFGVLNRIRKESWWVSYADLILENVMHDRVAGWSGLEEEKKAIHKLLETVDKKAEADFMDSEVVRLKSAVRLAVERNLEERVNNKKVTVGIPARSLKNHHRPFLPAIFHCCRADDY